MKKYIYQFLVSLVAFVAFPTEFFAENPPKKDTNDNVLTLPGSSPICEDLDSLLLQYEEELEFDYWYFIGSENIDDNNN